jgi:hypothetical protein
MTAMYIEVWSQKRPFLRKTDHSKSPEQGDRDRSSRLILLYTPSRPQQTIVDSDESDEEDIDWEDVGLNNVEANPTPPRKDDEFGDVSLEIITKKIQKRAAIAKRKPVTTAEKLLRLEAHEAHLLFLLFHVHVRNAWCNMPEVQVQPPCLSLRLFRQL